MPSKDGRALERKYEKVTCKRCKGTGTLSKKDGGIHTLHSNRRRKPRCHACQGWGYNIIGTIEEPYKDA